MYSIPMMIFLAGDSNAPAAAELGESLPPLTIFIPPDEKWKHLLKEIWGERLVANKRTHLDHTTLDIEHLRRLKATLPKKYTLKKLDSEMAAQINQEYTMQIQMYFGSKRNLVESGIGFGIMIDEKLVSYAYTPFPFENEFEIQVFTEDNPEYRRKGLATVVSAALIEYGLENDLVPHWDAANEASVKLAQKLGYSNPVPWTAYYYAPEKA
jgi:predicted GNAT family acetyltransferase